MEGTYISGWTVNLRVDGTRKVYILVAPWLSGSPVDLRIYRTRKVYILLAKCLGSLSVTTKVLSHLDNTCLTTEPPSHSRLILYQKWSCILQFSPIYSWEMILSECETTQHLLRILLVKNFLSKFSARFSVFLTNRYSCYSCKVIETCKYTWH